MNSITKHLLILSLAVVGFSSCTDIESVPVIAPTWNTDEAVQQAYKNNMFSRPMAIGMLYDWHAVNGISLYNTPDSLDVIVVKGNGMMITPAMAEDLKLTREIKKTKVLLGVDLNTIDELKAKDVKKELKTKRKALQETWTEENMPTPEEKEKFIMELEAQITDQAKSMMAENATKIVGDALSQMKAFEFDGISIKLPEHFLYLTKESAVAVLKSVTAQAANDKDYLLSIETPFEEGREEIEKAAWVIFDRNLIDRSLSQFTEEAQIWSETRFIPSANFKDANNGKGFPDSKVFDPTGKTPRTIDIINWQAPNKAGVAYYHIENDAKYNEGIRMSYLDLRYLINKLSLTK